MILQNLILQTTTNRLNTLLNTQDLTPNAERVLNTAKSELSQAELRNTNAKTAYANLTKEINNKRATYKEAEKALSKAKSQTRLRKKVLKKQLLNTTMQLINLTALKMLLSVPKRLKT